MTFDKIIRISSNHSKSLNGSPALGRVASYTGDVLCPSSELNITILFPFPDEVK